VLCRAGANTLWELAALGKPSVLVPLSEKASRGDQIENAERFAAQGAAVVVPQGEAGGLIRTVLHLLRNESKLAEMRHCALALGKPWAAAAIAELLVERLR